VVSTPASYLGGPRFKVWPRSWQPWLMFLVVLLDILKHSCSLTHPSQFTIHNDATAKHYITYTIPKVMLNNSRININTRKQKPNTHAFYLTYRIHHVPSGLLLQFCHLHKVKLPLLFKLPLLWDHSERNLQFNHLDRNYKHYFNNSNNTHIPEMHY